LVGVVKNNVAGPKQAKTPTFPPPPPHPSMQNGVAVPP
jgi:hypothetical protein